MVANVVEDGGCEALEWLGILLPGVSKWDTNELGDCPHWETSARAEDERVLDGKLGESRILLEGGLGPVLGNLLDTAEEDSVPELWGGDVVEAELATLSKGEELTSDTRGKAGSECASVVLDRAGH